jgi:hypothetical protein
VRRLEAPKVKGLDHFLEEWRSGIRLRILDSSGAYLNLLVGSAGRINFFLSAFHLNVLSFQSFQYRLASLIASSCLFFVLPQSKMTRVAPCSLCRTHPTLSLLLPAAMHGTLPEPYFFDASAMTENLRALPDRKMRV